MQRKQYADRGDDASATGAAQLTKENDMKPQMMLCGLMIAALATAAFAEEGKSADEIMKKVAELNKKLDSYRVKSVTTTKMPQMESRSVTTQDVKRSGDEMMTRTEAETRMEMKFGGQSTVNETKQVTVDDGEFMYTLSDSNGQKMASKMKRQKADPNAMEKAAETMNMEYLGEEKVDGRDAWKVKTTPKDSAMAASGSTTTWYCQKTGLPLKMVITDGEGEPTTEMIVQDVDLSPSFDDGHFKFEAPAGVTVIDMSQG